MAKQIDNLDVSKITVGQEIKNFKDLFTLLGIPMSTGEKLRSIKEDLKRFIDYEKVENSNKIKILNVYEKPLPFKEVIDGRKKGNNVKYAELIKNIFISLLIKNNGYMQGTITNFYHYLGMVNSNYRNNFFEKYLYNKFKPSDIERFYNFISDIKLRGYLNTVFNKLEADSIIKITQYYKIEPLNNIVVNNYNNKIKDDRYNKELKKLDEYNDDDIKNYIYNELNISNNQFIGFHKKYNNLDDNPHNRFMVKDIIKYEKVNELIKRVEKEEAEAMGFKNKYEVHEYHKGDKFHKNVCERLGVKNYYIVYGIEYLLDLNKDNIIDIEKEKEILNEKLVNNLKEYIDRDYTKKCKKAQKDIQEELSIIKIGAKKEYSNTYRKTHPYLYEGANEINKELVDLLIKINN